MDSKRIHIENTKEQLSATNSIQKKSNTQSVVSLQDNRPKSVLQKKQIENSLSGSATNSIQKKENRTGLPDNLKSGIENLSGHSMDDVKVHYNSSKPESLNAHAYAQGSDIHIASGQEKHLAHEAWHVVQQKQGRVKPTLQMKGKVNINDDKGLEKEADVMGAKAVQMKSQSKSINLNQKTAQNTSIAQLVRATKGDMALDAVINEEKASLMLGKKEIGYVTYASIGNEVIAQNYIHVDSAYQRQGISYLLTYLSAIQEGHKILYLRGSSLSISGSTLSKKFGFKQYEPKKNTGGGFCSWFSCCFGSSTTDEDAPLIPKGNIKMLNYAYEYQKREADGDIPPIKWIEISTLRQESAAKVKESGWTIKL